jgi:hypothetical protein
MIIYLFGGAPPDFILVLFMYLAGFAIALMITIFIQIESRCVRPSLRKSKGFKGGVIAGLVVIGGFVLAFFIFAIVKSSMALRHDYSHSEWYTRE